VTYVKIYLKIVYISYFSFFSFSIKHLFSGIGISLSLSSAFFLFFLEFYRVKSYKQDFDSKESNITIAIIRDLEKCFSLFCAVLINLSSIGGAGQFSLQDRSVPRSLRAFEKENKSLNI